MLTSDGQFVWEFGEATQMQTVRRVLLEHSAQFGVTREPWFFPTVDEYRTLISALNTQHGVTIEVTRNEQVRPFPQLKDLMTWMYGHVFTAYTSQMSASDGERFCWTVADVLPRVLIEEDGTFDQQYVRIVARAAKSQGSRSAGSR